VRNADRWMPSKFVYRRGKLRASRDWREMSVSSQLIADRVAALYDAHIPTHCRGRLVDLGCGKAPLYQAYKPHVTDITCVDWSSSLHGSAYVDVECDLTKPLPFGEGVFDTIILSDVLEHLPEPAKMWGEMQRILADEGTILLNVPFLYLLHEQPHDYFRYTEYALRRFAADHGFRVLVLRPIGGVPEVLADIVAKNVVRLPVVGATCAVTIQRITWHFGKTRLGKGISARTGVAFPLGYFMVAEKVGKEDSA
jgi:SAM-dependent methyltransferase